MVANGQNLTISGIGSINMNTPQHHRLTLSNAYFIPNLFDNLLSVGQLVDNRCLVDFTSSGCIIYDRHSGEVIEMGSKNGRTFLLDVGLGSSFFYSSRALTRMWTVWHQCLRHLHNDKLMFLFNMDHWILLLITNCLVLICILNVLHAIWVKAMFYLFLLIILGLQLLFISYIWELLWNQVD